MHIFSLSRFQPLAVSENAPCCRPSTATILNVFSVQYTILIIFFCFNLTDADPTVLAVIDAKSEEIGDGVYRFKADIREFQLFNSN